MFTAKQFAGTHCGCRYQQDYRPTLGKDGKKESGTLEVIKFYYDGAIRILYFDGGVFPWKLADDFDEDKRWGYPKWKVLLGKLTGKGRKCD